MKNSRIDLLHSVAMVARALDMAVNVAMEIGHQIGPAHMVAMEDMVILQLPSLQAAS
jgi:hypothetical protein